MNNPNNQNLEFTFEIFIFKNQTWSICIQSLREQSDSASYKQLILLVNHIFFKIIIQDIFKYKQSLRQPIQTQEISSSQKIYHLIQQLSEDQFGEMMKCLDKIGLKLKDTIYSLRMKMIKEHCEERYEWIQSKEGVGYRRIGWGDKQRMDDFCDGKEERRKFVVQNNIVGLKSGVCDGVDRILEKGKEMLSGKFTNQSTLFAMLCEDIFPILQAHIMSININHHQQRQQQLLKIIRFISTYYISPFQIQVHISKNILVESRLFQNQIHQQFLRTNAKYLLRNVIQIINQALLTPSNIQIQIELFTILRRLYMLQNQSQSLIDNENANDNEYYKSKYENWMENNREEGASSSRNDLRQGEGQWQKRRQNYIVLPLFLNTNWSSESSSEKELFENQIKQCAMFCYKIVTENHDQQLSHLLTTSTSFKFIQDSKYYSSKAYAYSLSSTQIYDIHQLSTPFFKYQRHLNPRQFWHYNLIVEKPSTLIYWEINVLNYDVGLAFYKMEEVNQNLNSMEAYEKGEGCKEVMKLQKICSQGSNSPHRGHLFLKNGFYRFIIDNSYSMVRGKDITYMFLHLESTNY